MSLDLLDKQALWELGKIYCRQTVDALSAGNGGPFSLTRYAQAYLQAALPEPRPEDSAHIPEWLAAIQEHAPAYLRAAGCEEVDPGRWKASHEHRPA